jgi:4-hydroxythreonine-4-phosphate dehydrogenase
MNDSAGRRAVRIGLVLGDPAGIGLELAARLLVDPELRALAAVAVIGDARAVKDGAEIAGVALDLPAIGPSDALPDALGEAVLIELGHLDPATLHRGEASAASGAFALKNFEIGLALAGAGRIDAILFTPFNKLALKLAGNPYEDELQFAVDRLGHRGAYSEFNILDRIWNARVTSHVPLREVARLITGERVLNGIRLTERCMREAGFARPRIAVAALNPHAGDGGNFGREEIDILTPAVAEAKRLQIAVEGPFPSDTVYLRVREGKFDAVLSMFHDQGQIAIKLMGFERGVTLLGGLPVPITTPAHGTAYDLAGKGVANPGAARAAFRLAVEMASRRRAP